MRAHASASFRKGHLLAASRNAAPHSPRRISFAKIDEPLEIPELLSLQTDSFDWLKGADSWRARVEADIAAGRSLGDTTTLADAAVVDTIREASRSGKDEE